MEIRTEHMNDWFTKYHIEGPWPFNPVFHRFTRADGNGDPHDHPWPFRSVILSGGYREEVFDLSGKSWFVDRYVGDSFVNEADHIHRIVELFEDECWTMILPQEGGRKPGFYQFREDGAYHRFWDGDWSKL